jgi:phosphotriesterase-related protein
MAEVAGRRQPREEGALVPSVNTVTGLVDVKTLGRTLMHEHVFTFHSDIQGDYPWKDEQKFVDAAVEKLHKLRSVGFDTIVDLTVFGLGRNVARVAGIAQRARFNVIVASGLYTYGDLPTYFHTQLTLSGPTFLEDLFVHEITEGIGETGIRSAILKCCTDRPGLTPDVETVLRSVARAHLRTGVPISTHSDPVSETGLIQQEVFRQEGVDLSRVIIGHSGDTTDLAYLEKLMLAGSYIGMDRFGLAHLLSEEDRVKTVAALCRNGYASRMVLSHDAKCGGDLRPEEALREWRYGHIPNAVIPALRNAGVSDGDLELMTRANPRAIFEKAAVSSV